MSQEKQRKATSTTQATSKLDEQTINDKVLRYESFLNDHLKEDLKKVHKKRDFLVNEMSEFIQLKNSIEAITDIASLEGGFKTKMNLGCSFYVQANVTDTSKILINVGLGCYVEFSMKEALHFIDKRVKLLTLQTEKLTKDSAKLKGMIKIVLGGLAELQKEYVE